MEQFNGMVYNHLYPYLAIKTPKNNEARQCKLKKFNLLTNNQTQYKSCLFAYQWFLLEMSQADGMQYLFNFVMFWSECLTLYIDIINAD